MASECRIEFYFKRADMEQLLKDNPTANAVIVSQQLVKTPQGAMANIRARALNDTGTATASPDDDQDIPGCPYPPGC